MANQEKYQPTDKAQAFLSTVQKGKYKREIITGLAKFLDNKIPEEMQGFYSTAELQTLVDLRGTSQDVESRMPVKITRHYFELAKTSAAIQTLVKASPKETYDLEGAPDPGKQMDYSPVEGLIHKYELGLIYVASTCSAHCRFCYREELIAKKEVERPDGTVAPKGLAQISEIVNYIQEHNGQVAANGDPDALRIMQRELRRNSVENHYFFCGRDIIGHRAFNLPIEEVWNILNESQKGLSGVESHARLSITHYRGKTEVAAVTNESLAGIPGTENGFVVLKLLRGAADAPDRGKVTIVGRNPDAIWFSGYDDRVIYDEAGLFAHVGEEEENKPLLQHA
jgi:L-lysine 2,3-aminomutase